MMPRILLARGKANIQVSRPQSNSHCASGVRLGRSLLKGACHRHFRFPSSVPNGFRCRIAEPVSSASPSQVAETSRERVTLPSRFRVTDVFAPPRRQRASTTAGAAFLATTRVRPFAKSAPRAFPDKSGTGSEVCLAAFPTRCLGVWSLTRRAVGATRYLP